ncbi:hypothetical protein L9G16_07395 [Shewanella sp. A25]|nr:hypothetical protein [Shewanella shenzhenensis]
MLVNRLSFAILLSLCSTATMAANDNAFQHQAEVAYTAPVDHFGEGVWEGGYSYYFTPVSQDTHPYVLSGYLAQTSFINGYVASEDSGYDAFSITGQHVFDSKWFVSADYTSYSSDWNDGTTPGVAVGYYFNSTSSVYVSYHRSEDDIDVEPGFSAQSDADILGLGIRSYLPLESTTGIELEARLSSIKSDLKATSAEYGVVFRDSNETEMLDLYADWYLTRSWSIGASYSLGEGEDPYGINSAYFWRITDAISLATRVEKFYAADLNDLFATVGVNGRF